MCPRPIERKNSFQIMTSYSPRSDIRDCLIVTSFNDQSVTKDSTDTACLQQHYSHGV